MLVLAAVAGVVLYVAAYWLMLDETGRAGTRHVRATGVLGLRYYKRVDEYLIDDEMVRRFFWPANQLDRLVRPRTWAEPMEGT
jgi:hypothetical protein